MAEGTNEPTGTAAGADGADGGAADGGKVAMNCDPPKDGGAGGKPAGTPADGAADGDGAKPYLGEPKPAGGADGGKGGKPDGEGKDGEGGKGAPATDEDYMKALAKDETLLGDDKRLTLDADLYRAVLPVMKKHGVTPAAANELANALARAQIDDARARMQERLDYFEKMKQESLRTYTPRDFEIINAGIDRWFKPGGVMNHVIRNSELGADPEFLALMRHLGEAAAEDGAAGAAEGAGAGGGTDGNSIQGMAAMW